MAVEVFVEEDVVAPVGIGLKLLRATVDGTTAVCVTQKDAREARAQLAAHLEEIHQPSRAHRALDLEIVAVVQVEKAVLLIPHAAGPGMVHARGDPEEVQRHPGRAIGLLEVAPGGQRRAAVEHPDIVEPEEALPRTRSYRCGPCG